MPEVGWVRCGAMDQDSIGQDLGVVTQVWRYPVKSMMGERLDSVTLGPEGVVGDRTWAVRDEVRGGIRGAKKLHGLMDFAARYTSEPPAETVIDAEITLPDGTTLSTGAEDASEQVSKALDHPSPSGRSSRRTTSITTGAGPRTRPTRWPSCGRCSPSSPTTRCPTSRCSRPRSWSSSRRPGTYVDAFPLLVMTEQSLASLQAALPASVIDVRRFRPSILLSAAADGYPEQAWVGRRLRIGEATVEIGVGCPRCVMTTLGFADLPPDRGIMRGLVRETSQILGVYASVVEPGPVRVGDAVLAA